MVSNHDECKELFDDRMEFEDSGVTVATSARALPPGEAVGTIEISQYMNNWAAPGMYVSNQASITLTIEQLRQIISSATGTLIGHVTGDILHFRHSKEQLYAALRDKRMLLKVIMNETPRSKEMICELSGASDVSDDFVEFVRSLCTVVYIELSDRSDEFNEPYVDPNDLD